MNHYEVLDVPKTATPAEIKRAYKRMAKKHHPDRGGDAKQMVLINKAHDTLMDPAKREHYDATGEDKPQTAIDIEARNSIMQCFGAYITQPGVNIPKRAVAALKEAKQKFAAEITKAKKELAALEKRRDEVQCDEPENLWKIFMDSVVQEANKSVTVAEHKVAIADRALEMMQAYRSDKVDGGQDPIGQSMFGDFESFVKAAKAAKNSGSYWRK